MWLADKLPRNWSQARIMIYGYRSPIMGSRSRQTLQDIAKTFNNNLVKMRKSPSVRNHVFSAWPILCSATVADPVFKLSTRCIPLVFLSHSLGGLVVKQALVNLSKQSSERELKETFQSVYAMLFFGVPCKG